jgi:predicted nucleic acid-binding Zn ribbon protein
MKDIQNTNTQHQHCPACNRYVKVSAQFPSYACKKCLEKAVDYNGKPILFSIVAKRNLLKVKGSNIKTSASSTHCFIKDIRFSAKKSSNQIFLVPVV